MAGRRGTLVRPDPAPAVRRRHRSAHRMIWLVLAGLLPGIVLLSLTLRPIGPAEAPQVQLAPPK